MKHPLVLLAALILFLTSACRNGNTTENTDTATPATATDTPANGQGVSLLCASDNALFVALTDMENEMNIALFRGSANDELLAQLMPTGAMRSSINAFLVIESSEYLENDRKPHRILFDAGLGADKGGQMMTNLKEEADPSEIDAIFLTHLHADHIGGLLLDGQKAFPNATIYLSQEELEAWSDRGPFADRNGLWKEVQKAYKGCIKTFRDGERLCDGLVEAILAPGHTPGHTVYKVDGGTCYMVGDLLHVQDLQIDHPEFCASFDHDPTLAVQTRKRFLNLLNDGSKYMAAAHCYDHFINLHDRAENL